MSTMGSSLLTDDRQQQWAIMKVRITSFPPHNIPMIVLVVSTLTHTNIIIGPVPIRLVRDFLDIPCTKNIFLLF